MTITAEKREGIFRLDSRREEAEPHWYAAYTCANHEKRVAEQMRERSVDHFLPQYRALRRWKDRRVALDLPLFPGYVFVRVALSERLRVLQVPSVVRLVSFGGRPVELPDEQMTRLLEGLSSKVLAGPHPYLTVGRRVRILRGALEGMEGILLRLRGSVRVVLSLELILRSISVEVDAGDIAPAA
ncbi:MAG: UpxY family transcription antiterminator [Candidatus Acidiferrales bacterium]